MPYHRQKIFAPAAGSSSWIQADLCSEEKDLAVRRPSGQRRLASTRYLLTTPVPAVHGLGRSVTSLSLLLLHCFWSGVRAGTSGTIGEASSTSGKLLRRYAACLGETTCSGDIVEWAGGAATAQGGRERLLVGGDSDRRHLQDRTERQDERSDASARACIWGGLLAGSKDDDGSEEGSDGTGRQSFRERYWRSEDLKVLSGEFRASPEKVYCNRSVDADNMFPGSALVLPKTRSYRWALWFHLDIGRGVSSPRGIHLDGGQEYFPVREISAGGRCFYEHIGVRHGVEEIHGRSPLDGLGCRNAVADTSVLSCACVAEETLVRGGTFGDANEYPGAIKQSNTRITLNAGRDDTGVEEDIGSSVVSTRSDVAVVYKDARYREQEHRERSRGCNHTRCSGVSDERQVERSVVTSTVEYGRDASEDDQPGEKGHGDRGSSNPQDESGRSGWSGSRNASTRCRRSSTDTGRLRCGPLPREQNTRGEVEGRFEACKRDLLRSAEVSEDRGRTLVGDTFSAGTKEEVRTSPSGKLVREAQGSLHLGERLHEGKEHSGLPRSVRANASVCVPRWDLPDRSCSGRNKLRHNREARTKDLGNPMCFPAREGEERLDEALQPKRGIGQRR